MISTPPETDLRRQSLLTQLAAILQVNADVASGTSAIPGEAGLPTAADSPPPAPGNAHGESGGPSAEALRRDGEFVPIAPNEFSKLRLAEAEVESLILKFLLNRQNATGGEIAKQIGISFCICERILHAMKADRLVVFKVAAKMGDYVYELTESGTHRGRKFARTCGYFGAAPSAWKTMRPASRPSRCRTTNRASTTSAARSPT